jgi:hypothetical protein
VARTTGHTAWRSRGSGDFEVYTAATDGGDCKNPMDFNGDGRGECLWPSSDVTSSRLTASTGSQLLRIGNFNLAVTGGPGLKGSDKGVRTLDINGDGRTDILRWHDSAGSTNLYLSNGDGSFTLSSSFNLGSTSANRLVTSGSSYNFVSGDFLGNGSLQILRLRHDPSSGEGNTNQLYVKTNPALPDQLTSVISPTGVKTILSYTSMANAGGRYSGDRGTGNAAAYPLLDLTLPMPLVTTLTSDTGVGNNTVSTQFAYRGLKAATDGRGMLGFRQTVQQSTAPNGEAISVWTDYLLNEPYAGVARRAETRRGAWNNASAQLLSSTVNTYCDSTSTVDPNTATETAPCTSSVKVRRPYLRKSIESGNDLAGTALPMVTTVNTYNNYGDPTQVSVTTSAVVAGASRDYTKTTVNEQCAPDTAGCPNKIAGDNWILGRLTRSTVSSSVPNLLSALTASAGDAPNANATTGVAQVVLNLANCTSTTPTTAPAAATMNCTVSNVGQLNAGSISYSVPAGTSASGPTGACAAGTNCGTVIVTTSTAAGTYSGTLTATPNVGGAATQAVNLVVRTPAALALSSCSGISPTTTPNTARLICTLSNNGQTAASSISYTTASGTTVAGPTGACAANTTCGTVTVTTGTAAAAYTGTLTATPNAGTAATQPISLTVQPVALFTYVTTSANTASPKIITFTFRNDNASTVSITARGLTVTPEFSSLVSITGGTCTIGAALASGATCTVTVRAYWAAISCDAMTYDVGATLSNLAGTRTASMFRVFTSPAACSQRAPQPADER